MSYENPSQKTPSEKKIWIDFNLGRQMDGWVGGWMNGWVDGWMDGQLNGEELRVGSTCHLRCRSKKELVGMFHFEELKDRGGTHPLRLC